MASSASNSTHQAHKGARTPYSKPFTPENSRKALTIRSINAYIIRSKHNKSVVFPRRKCGKTALACIFCRVSYFGRTLKKAFL
nr:MAG TPA: hypothetical protein [Bacteriophage sp.]